MYRSAHYLEQEENTDSLKAIFKKAIQRVPNKHPAVEHGNGKFSHYLYDATWVQHNAFIGDWVTLKRLAIEETRAVVKHLRKNSESVAELLHYLNKLALLLDPWLSTDERCTEELIAVLEKTLLEKLNTEENPEDATVGNLFAYHEVLVVTLNGEERAYTILLPPRLKEVNGVRLSRDMSYMREHFGEGTDPVLKELEDLCADGATLTATVDVYRDTYHFNVVSNLSGTIPNYIERIMGIKEHLEQECLKVSKNWKDEKYPIIVTDVQLPGGTAVIMHLPPKTVHE